MGRSYAFFFEYDALENARICVFFCEYDAVEKRDWTLRARICVFFWVWRCGKKGLDATGPYLCVFFEYDAVEKRDLVQRAVCDFCDDITDATVKKNCFYVRVGAPEKTPERAHFLLVKSGSDIRTALENACG